MDVILDDFKAIFPHLRTSPFHNNTPRSVVKIILSVPLIILLNFRIPYLARIHMKLFNKSVIKKVKKKSFLVLDIIVFLAYMGIHLPY